MTLELYFRVETTGVWTQISKEEFFRLCVPIDFSPPPRIQK